MPKRYEHVKTRTQTSKILAIENQSICKYGFFWFLQDYVKLILNTFIAGFWRHMMFMTSLSQFKLFTDP